MKQSAKKPRSLPVKKKTAGKKRRGKLQFKDRIRAVFAAGILIFVAGFSVLVMRGIHLEKADSGEIGAPSRVPGFSPEKSGLSGEAVAGQTEAEPSGAESVPRETAPELTRAPSPPKTGSASAGENLSSGKPAVVSAAPARSPALPVKKTETAAGPVVSSAPARSSGVNPAASAPSSIPKTGSPVSSRPAGAVERPVPEHRGSLSFVFDDAGNNLRELEPFLRLPGSFTVAVLPGLPHSVEAARRIRAAGKEVFLHQPMESLGGTNPGPGAIRAGMGREEIRAIVNRNLDELWPVSGVNNHEGSRVTMDEEAMETILALCRERGILFLDSRTTADTSVPGVARRLGLVIGERDVFVDNEQDTDSMIYYINTGLQKAGQKGSAILIGHVWSPALAPLLEKMIPDLEGRGYSFFPVSRIINRKGYESFGD